MQLTKRFEIQSARSIEEFLNTQPVGRIATIDQGGFPQVIPMNFVFVSGCVYMHSHPHGEKLDNLKRNSRVGFEVDQHVCFLPSYYFHPSDASQADTLYISVVIKGRAEIVGDAIEKAMALNALMKKYQKEGGYDPLTASMRVVEEVAIIKVTPVEMHGKYKIGQHWSVPYRLKIASSIVSREGSLEASRILEVMGIKLGSNGRLDTFREPVM
ncbi:MAG: pyridoxamine 5'-phosphate oxidase family protein [Nitrososphaera sp.]